MTSATDFNYTQRARGIYPVFGVFFAMFLATGFWLTDDFVGRGISVILAALVFNGIYGFLKGEVCKINIHDNILTWSYPRWPKSSGNINLNDVQKIIIDDCSSTLFFTLKNGESMEIKLLGYGAEFRDYVKLNFPNIGLEFIPGI